MLRRGISTIARSSNRLIRNRHRIAARSRFPKSRYILRGEDGCLIDEPKRHIDTEGGARSYLQTLLYNSGKLETQPLRKGSRIMLKLSVGHGQSEESRSNRFWKTSRPDLNTLFSKCCDVDLRNIRTVPAVRYQLDLHRRPGV